MQHDSGLLESHTCHEVSWRSLPSFCLVDQVNGLIQNVSLQEKEQLAWDIFWMLILQGHEIRFDQIVVPAVFCVCSKTLRTGPKCQQPCVCDLEVELFRFASQSFEDVEHRRLFDSPLKTLFVSVLQNLIVKIGRLDDWMRTQGHGTWSLQHSKILVTKKHAPTRKHPKIQPQYIPQCL